MLDQPLADRLSWAEIRRLALRHTGPMLAVGVSLGGNALLRSRNWLLMRAGKRWFHAALVNRRRACALPVK